ncbi:LysR family transcriptional regulator [Vibrio coralliilyticus]|uniref:LysR family transcriptional regulator n=1 Tax=Vibrio coralliilyticus TaxID=190893 RepID=UPI0015614855|nr:LysR family transcriptional regulator [Vibrio coralliilyticus]NRF30980.1 LysR family transcriptional regulator [Vibrio coralliilyticus]NRF51051.1 LysR family transcriptional regulator [Vibrio coralliilyticus]NRG03920.1 LysR family transcriptional regulator [Vibrio coralliilyticus]
MDKDLNLLKLLVVLHEQKQTTLAAQKMRLSQPTVSSMLKKLREQFDDQLFIRNRNQLEPTPKCEQIVAQLPDIFSQIEDLYSEHTEWDIADESGEIKVYFPAHLINLIAPPLILRVHQCAPQLTIECGLWTSDTLTKLEQDKFSWGISHHTKETNKTLWQQRLVDDQFILLMRECHPLRSSKLEEVLQYPLCVAIPIATEQTNTEVILKKYKLNKKVSARVADVGVMLKLLEDSDFLGIASGLTKYALPEGIRWEPLPSEQREYNLHKPLSFFTSSTNQHRPMTQWLYEEIAAIIASSQSPNKNKK